MDQHTGDKWLIHGTKRHKDNSCKAFSSPVEYPSRECKHNVKKFDGNMVNPIFKEDVQGWKHPGSCTFAEPEPLSYRKSKHEVHNEKIGHKLSIIVTTVMMKTMMKYNSTKEVVKWSHYDNQHQNSTYPKTSPTECEVVQLTNAQSESLPSYFSCHGHEFP